MFKDFNRKNFNNDRDRDRGYNNRGYNDRDRGYNDNKGYNREREYNNREQFNDKKEEIETTIWSQIMKTGTPFAHFNQLKLNKRMVLMQL